MKPTLLRRVVSEYVATLFLLATVVGSGIMGERLAAGNAAIALLANSLATGAALIALILTFGPVSGAHMNPVVTLAAARTKAMRWSETPFYLIAQIAGAISGVFAAHVMFGLPILQSSTRVRTGTGQLFSEFVATFGLMVVIAGCTHFRSSATPYAVGAYITAAYWFTASTSFANPAVTLARCLTNTFAGIRPQDVWPFVLVQLFAALMALTFSSWIFASRADALMKQ
jgi:glycerol uptake facilitator-like aquaporin